jgi:hypothetical protein
MMDKACTIFYIITTDWIISSQCDILKIKLHIYKTHFDFLGPASLDLITLLKL